MKVAPEDHVEVENVLIPSSEAKNDRSSVRYTRSETASFFILAILGFSFWFFMAVPFASHRETYWWLAMVRTHRLSDAFAWGISSTYRPLAQAVTWLSFRILDPGIFPTSVPRQMMLQTLVYALFVTAWWLVFRAATERRLFALIAFFTGGIFFSGYVHLFHLYGLFYAPVILMLGALLSAHASHTFERKELWFAAAAMALAFWHPFATALFLGYYFGFYLETFRGRSRERQARAILIFLCNFLVVAALVALFPRVRMPLEARLPGFLVSYRTNEINVAASLAACLLAVITVFSMKLSRRLAFAAALAVALLGGLLIVDRVPVLFLWFTAVLVKLFRNRCWSLFFLALAAAFLPLGGAIGTPMYALFSIALSVYITASGWSDAENALSFLRTRHVMSAVIVSGIVLGMVRAGTAVRIVTKAAKPLLSERERTYQLENMLAWLHSSRYCGYDIAFLDKSGSPADSLENAITRENRPPAAIEDVRLFWNTVLQCRKPQTDSRMPGTAILTFGRPAPAGAIPVFELDGRYGGKATLWLSNSQN